MQQRWTDSASRMIAEALDELHDLRGLVHARLPGPAGHPVVRARTGGSFVDLTHIGPTVVTFNIDIPAWWNTYDVEVLAVGRVAAQAAAPSTGVVKTVMWQVVYDGVAAGQPNTEALIIPTAANVDKVKIQTVAATAVDQTVTGTRAVAITGTLDSSGENDEWRAIFPEARATAWWTS